MEIIKGETPEHNKALEKALDYIVDVTFKQNRLLPFKTLYGDGTRWLPLSEKGFEIVYNSVKAGLILKGYNPENSNSIEGEPEKAEPDQKAGAL